MPASGIKRSVILLACVYLGAGALAAGCGQKGPLYMPVEEGKQKQETQTPETIKSGSPSGNT